MKRLEQADRERIERVIAAHLGELAQVQGFLTARAGFPVAGGRLIREPAILVFVREKRAPTALAAPDLLPREIDGIRVDVVHADPRTELELRAQRAETAALRGAPAVPASPDSSVAVAAATAAAAAADAAFAAVTQYEGLPDDPIDVTFTLNQPVLCHVGPDSGWAVLRDFLAGSREGLTAAMYDFNADYIERTLVEVAEGQGVGITLTIDNGFNAAERAIHDRLRARLAAAYDAEIVFCRKNARFPSAYHEKVAVRDGTSFWLSSGNWSRRSQPEIDPIGDPATAQGMFSKGNREWHVIVDDQPLAELFARYITHDLQKARLDAAAAAGEEALDRPDIFVRLDDLMAEAAMAAFAAPPVPVAPQRLPSEPRAVTVRPLLSPDNYARRIDELIRGAERRLLLQYSYVNWSDDERDRALKAVLEFLGELSWREDFDLRVIMNASDAREKTRILAEHGWNDEVVRQQTGVHNKGIVADSARVLVSSQNWSGDGFLRNRDAGLIIEDPEIAAYYERVFLDDWDRRSKSPFAGQPNAMLAREGDPTPSGMVRMTWRDFFGE